VDPSRRHVLLQQVAAAPGLTIAHKLCTVSLAYHLDGAAIVLQADPTPTGTAATAGALGDALAQLELTLGEGPGHEAIKRRSTVFADQLITGPSEHWPVFAAQARARQIGSVFAFPLHLGSICVGAFEVCRITPAKLTAQELIDLSHLASLATSALLLMQSGLQEGDLMDLLEASDPNQLRVHQAMGMVAQQATVSLSDALALMRGHALTNDLSLTDVAEQVVTRRIRMDTP
jgi:transcriptional regulator with GAF, ATPase, and Fis domain